MTDTHRVESDSMGEVRVPADAYYGAQTERARRNFPVSGARFPRRFIRALGLVKGAAAEVNRGLGHLDGEVADAIREAADEVAAGTHDDQFVVDVFQTGSGTSTNMNANEVIANRAIEILGGAPGTKEPVHPNDHVNFGQSSNDVIPTAIHVAAVDAYEEDLLPALGRLARALETKADEWDDIVKVGRTHLMDAMPVRLGQEVSGWARQIRAGIERVDAALDGLLELAIGGTAVGTGVNTDPAFPGGVVDALSDRTGHDFREAPNRFEALAARDALVFASGANKTLAASLSKIGNDLRWMGSGPRCGLGEMTLPAVQPGSSIMPGKINPVLPEALVMVCAQVTGHDATIGFAGSAGNFELNVMKPVMARCLLEQIGFLAGAVGALTGRCVEGLEPDREQLESYVERSSALATALAPSIGYDEAAEVAKEAMRSGRTVREVAREREVLPPDELERVLDPLAMTERGIPGRREEEA